jgi:hypothetical protein
MAGNELSLELYADAFRVSHRRRAGETENRITLIAMDEIIYYIVSASEAGPQFAVRTHPTGETAERGAERTLPRED